MFDCYKYVSQPDGTMKKTKKYHSVTVSDPSKKGKRECERLALEWATLHEEEKEKLKTGSDLTFGEALDRYIADREAALSPRTISEYKRVRKSCLQSLMPLRINEITQADIQKAVNDMTLKLAPKTVRNRYGVAKSVMKQFRPNFAINVILPKKVRYNLHVPTEDEISKVIEGAKGTAMYLPIMLAAFGSMRRSEISAIDMSDVIGNTIHVKQAMVQNADKEWVIKAPKSYAGDRFITYPDFVAELWKDKKSGLLVELNPTTITRRFFRLLDKLGIPHFRFHDLRHFYVSEAHSLGVPDSYIQKTGGWGTDTTMKNIYRHVMTDKEDIMTQIVTNHFEKLMK